MEIQSKTNGVQSVERAFSLLEQIAETARELSLSELSAMVGLPAPTAYRLLRTMMAMGYVRQLSSRRYGLGLGLMRLGGQADNQVAPVAAPYLQTLVRRIGETASFAILDGDRAVYLAQAPSPHPMGMFIEVGRRTFLHATGVGKAILSQLDPNTARRIVTRAGMPRATDRTISNPVELGRDLAAVRERGYAIDDGEGEVGMRCYAVPVSGLPVQSALSVSGPAARMTEAVGLSVVPIMQQTAAALSREFRGSSAPL